jgi:hypothetical protein
MTVRADDNLSLQARDVIKLRLNTGSAWNELFVESGALLLNGHDIDIIPKMYCLVRTYEQEALIRWMVEDRRSIISLRFTRPTVLVS